MATKNNPGLYDCYANAGADEPLFVLLGRDKHAPMLVQLWALLRARNGEDEDKVHEAISCAAAMQTFKMLRDGTGALSGVEKRIRDEMFLIASNGRDQHPEEFDEACDCNLCRQYGAEGEGSASGPQGDKNDG